MRKIVNSWWIQRSVLAFLLLVVCLAAGRPLVAMTEKTLVDINTASVSELMKVDGMRETWARRIVRFRPYRVKTDLVGKGIVTREVYQRFEDKIVAHRVAKKP